MILLEKRAHLIPEIPLGVVRLLLVDVMQERANIRWTDGEQSVPALPRKLTNSVLLHPYGRSGLDLGHNFGRRSCRPQSHRKMNMVRNPTHAKALAIQLARDPGKISVKTGADVIVDQRRTMLRAENDMHQIETERLRHRRNYMSGLQPSPVSADTYLGLRPRLVCRQAFGLQLLPEPMIMSQPEVKQRIDLKPVLTKADLRNTLGSQAPQIMSAKGATTYQPGPKAQVGNIQRLRGLKARHIVPLKPSAPSRHKGELYVLAISHCDIAVSSCWSGPVVTSQPWLGIANTRRGRQRDNPPTSEARLLDSHSTRIPTRVRRMVHASSLRLQN